MFDILKKPCPFLYQANQSAKDMTLNIDIEGHFKTLVAYGLTKRQALETINKGFKIAAFDRNSTMELYLLGGYYKLVNGQLVNVTPQ